MENANADGYFHLTPGVQPQELFIVIIFIIHQAISIASVMSDRLCISSSYEFRKPLSAQQLVSCCKNCCSCNGGNIQLGWEYVKQKGLVTGGGFNSNLVSTKCK